MHSPKSTFMGDLLGATLSVIFFSLLIEAVRLEGQTSFTRLVFDSIAGFLAYFVGFALFSKNLDFLKTRTIFFPVIVGSLIWVTYKIVKGLVIDWGFLEQHPGQIYARHISIAVKIGIVLVPVLILNSSAFVILSRLARKLITPAPLQ